MSKKFKKSMKIVNIGKENLYNFQTTCEISMKISEMMSLMIILKVARNQDFSASLENKVLEKPQGGLGVGAVKLTTPQTLLAFLELINN